jgi:hypothetical protein
LWFAILATLLATGRSIVLRVASRRLLTASFASALLNALISFSFVCHTFLPFVRWLEISGRQRKTASRLLRFSNALTINRYAKSKIEVNQRARDLAGR